MSEPDLVSHPCRRCGCEPRIRAAPASTKRAKSSPSGSARRCLVFDSAVRQDDHSGPRSGRRAQARRSGGLVGADASFVGAGGAFRERKAEHLVRVEREAYESEFGRVEFYESGRRGLGEIPAGADHYESGRVQIGESVLEGFEAEIELMIVPRQNDIQACPPEGDGAPRRHAEPIPFPRVWESSRRDGTLKVGHRDIGAAQQIQNATAQQ